MTAAQSIPTETWYGHLSSIDPETAAALERRGICDVMDVYEALGPQLIMIVGELKAEEIAEELAPPC